MSIAQKQTATQSQKLMIFVLSMSLYGLATLFTELIPKFQVGVVEFSVEYFLFIPLTLAMLFDPPVRRPGRRHRRAGVQRDHAGSVRRPGRTGEVPHRHHRRVHRRTAGEGSQKPRHGGRGRHHRNRRPTADGNRGGHSEGPAGGRGLRGRGPGLPESVFATEGFAFLNDLLFSGILFCLLPTLYLVPKLYGKIEPLLGMAPRTPDSDVSGISPKALAVCAVGFVCAIVAELSATAGMSLIDWGGRVGRERHRPGGRHGPLPPRWPSSPCWSSKRTREKSCGELR